MGRGRNAGRVCRGAASRSHAASGTHTTAGANHDNRSSAAGTTTGTPAAGTTTGTPAAGTTAGTPDHDDNLGAPNRGAIRTNDHDNYGRAAGAHDYDDHSATGTGGYDNDCDAARARDHNDRRTTAGVRGLGHTQRPPQLDRGDARRRAAGFR